MARSAWSPLTSVAPEIERLIALYVRAVYSAQPPSPADQLQAIQTWRWLRWRLGLAWMRLKIENFTLSLKKLPKRWA